MRTSDASKKITDKLKDSWFDAPMFKHFFHDGATQQNFDFYEVEIALKNWRKNKDAAKGLYALWVLTQAKVEFPDDLGDWLVSSIATTFSGRGKISMEKAFGISDASGPHSAVGEFMNDEMQARNNSFMHRLVKMHCLSARLAACLIYERNLEQGMVDTFSSETIRTQYSRAKESLIRPTVMEGDPSGVANYERKILSDLNTTNLSPDDRAQLLMAIDAISD